MPTNLENKENFQTVLESSISINDPREGILRENQMNKVLLINKKVVG